MKIPNWIVDLLTKIFGLENGITGDRQKNDTGYGNDDEDVNVVEETPRS